MLTEAENKIISRRITKLKITDKNIYNNQTGDNKTDYGSQWDLKSMNYLLNEYNNMINNWYKRYLLNKKCLFLGCGYGTETIQARQFVKTIIGIDISIESIKNAKNNSLPDDEFLVSDAENLPFGNNSFDVVFCKSIVHHLPNLNKSLIEIRRVLVDGGVMFIAMEPSLLNPIAFMGRKFFPTNLHTPGETPFIPYRFNRIVSNHGFRIKDYKPFCLFSLIVPILAKFSDKNLFPLIDICIPIERILFKSPMKNMCWFFSGIWAKN